MQSAGAESTATSRGRRWRLGALLALALAVRLIGIGWGLPRDALFSYHPDEWFVVVASRGMVASGDLNPHFFRYPSLAFYLVAGGILATGTAESVHAVHVVARLLVALAGSATVALVLRLGARVRDERVGGYAALFLALMPGHALHSRFATVDVLATFFVALTLLLAARVAQEGATAARCALAGAAAGLAAGSKYTAGAVLVAALVASWIGAASAGPAGRLRVAARGAVASAGAALLAFVASTPFSVLDFRNFWRDLSYELFEHAAAGHGTVFVETGSGLGHHVATNLPYLLSPPLWILAIGGVATWLIRREPADRMLLAFVGVYVAMLGLSEVRFLRYTLPLAPALALAGASAVDAVGRSSRRVAALSWTVAAAYAALLSGLQARALLAPDPRDAAAAQLRAEAPAGASIGLLNVPWFYTPPLSPINGGPATREAFETRPEGNGGRFRLVICEGWDLEKLEREKPDYVVLSEFEWRDEERLGDERARRFLDSLERGYREAGRHQRLPRGWRRLFGRSFAPHDWLYPFAEVRIYRRAG